MEGKGCHGGLNLQVRVMWWWKHGDWQKIGNLQLKASYLNLCDNTTIEMN
jgi:hypothetical protein